jgi:acid phosphatase (class A)
LNKIHPSAKVPGCYFMKIARAYLFVNLPVLAIVLLFSVGSLRAAERLHYLTEGTLDAPTLLAPPPLPDSAEQKFDLAEVAAVQHACPSNELAEALIEDRGVSVHYFTPIIGDDLASGKLPATAALLRHALSDTEHIVNEAKAYWQRPRPCVIDPSLLMGRQISSYSYPSGHSTDSMTMALVLAELYPDKRDASAGIAWTSDVIIPQTFSPGAYWARPSYGNC